MTRLSRRSIAEYVATSLIEGKPSKKALLSELAAFLIDTQRTDELDLIVRDIEYYLAEKGYVRTNIVSAFDLSAETKKALEAFVKKATKATQVSLSSMVEPAVLGGVKISVPGRELDQTIVRQLTVLKTRFKKV
ncbi:MAG: atpH [Candidatus Saccharibacteria bacterium]|nr:atpH [Candidatus Saccharibacteria bacterium]